MYETVVREEKKFFFLMLDWLLRNLKEIFRVWDKGISEKPESTKASFIPESGSPGDKGS